MGINMFVVTDKWGEKDVAEIVDDMNMRYGMNDNIGEEEGKNNDRLFDWCDTFQGQGGFLLTLVEATAMTDEEAPFYIVSGDNLTSYSVEALKARRWVDDLKAFDPDTFRVIFLKCRG